MKRKLRNIFLFLLLHSLVSGVIWGLLTVYQRGYNTTHREYLKMASVTVRDSLAEVQLMESEYVVSIAYFSEESMLYYGIYVLSDEYLQGCFRLISCILSHD
jgi:hypothetical protein